MKTAGPDAAIAPLPSSQLRNDPPGEYVIKEFDTQAGVPNASGVIPSGATVTFLLWMRKTSTAGTLFPRAKLNLNSAAGTPLCTATGSAALTTSLGQYTLTCTTSSNITMAATDRFYLWTGVNLTVGPGNQSLFAELDIEGTLNGNYDSRITVPLPIPAPQISSLNPPSGEIGVPVTIAGSNFGATQGTSTVTFNTRPAAPTTWSDTSIVAPVPLGATTGPVVVTVQGVPSNGANFTVIAGAISGTVLRASDGTPFRGAQVEALQGGLVQLAATSGPDGAYSLPGLPAGTYDVRASLPGYATALAPGVAVTNGSTTTSNFSLNTGTPIRYIYGELGRLTAIIDPNSDSARYSYDATGNLLSITRQSASSVAILQFSPERGFPGASVAIYGTGFSTNPAQNSVQFNGIPASVSSAAPYQIVASVPAGATTGPISVTTPAGSATSSAPFVVPGDVTATIAPGGPPVRITIPTPAQNARVTFDGLAGQRVSLLINAITIPNSNVSILNPDGSTLKAILDVGFGQINFIDATTLPVNGSYTILVDPHSTYTGSITLTLYAVVDVTGTATADGSPVTVSTSVPGQNVRVTFSGSAGQRVSVEVVSGDISQSYLFLSILNPDGTTLAGPTSGWFLGATTLLSTGNHTILLDPFVTASGSMTFKLHNVVDVAGTLPLGSSRNDRTDTPGQNLRFTFTGLTGQKVSADTTTHNTTVTSPIQGSMSILKPDGTTLATTSSFYNVPFFGGGYDAEAYIDATVLPEAGTYALLIDPAGAYTGAFATRLSEVPPDATGTVTIGGAAATLNITVMGQNGSVTFDGTPGQQVTVHTSNTLYDPDYIPCSVVYSLLKPDGATLTSSTGDCNSSLNLTPQTLPVTGAYTVRVDPQGPAIGGVTVSVTSP